MRHLLTASLVSTALLASFAARAQQTPPSAEQIAKALSRPAAVSTRPLADDPLKITASMLAGPTRGIVPAQPVLPQAAVPTAANTPANPCPPGSGVCALYIEFETGSASLTASALAALDNLGKALTSLQGAGFRFRVEGHTDTVGGEDYNHALSEQRADTVTAYLNQHFAIDRDHLQPVGMGKDHPLVPTPDQTPEPRNRRVQVINLGA